MESIVDKLAEGYKDMIDATLSEEDSQVSDDKKEVLRSKLMSLFTEKLRLGLAYSFSQQMDKEILTEVTVDDALMKENALLSVASRRKRYPEKGAKILKSVYTANRKCLKELKVKGLKRKRELSGSGSSSEESDRPHLQLYELAGKKLKSYQNKVDANKEKASRLTDALKTLKYAEEASAVLRNVKVENIKNE